MFCKNCNEEIHGDMKNCPKCGCEIENGIEGNYGRSMFCSNYGN